MIGNKSFFNNLESCNIGYVTVGDGFKGKALGKGLSMQGLPQLENIVLFVDGLKANLLSFNPIYDDFHSVKFTKDKCHVLDVAGKVTLTGHSQGIIAISFPL